MNLLAEKPNKWYVFSVLLGLILNVIVFCEPLSYTPSSRLSTILKVLVGWSDVNEEDGTPIEFNDKTLKEFAEDIDFVAGVLDAFKKFYANAQSGN